MKRTGPVKVLFDFVDHVPVSRGSMACVATRPAEVSNAAPNESSIAGMLVCSSDFAKIHSGDMGVERTA